MENNFFLNILTFIRNLFRHGNLDDIDTSFDLLTEKGEMAVIKLPAPIPKLTEEFEATNIADKVNSAEQKKAERTIEFEHINEAEEINTDIFLAESEYEFDDETKRKIYETLKQIKDFERKVNKLRNLKFVRRDKNS